MNPYLTFGENQTCPSSYSPIQQFEPPPNQLPNVTHCLTEMVEPSLCRLCYSTYILKLLTGFLFVKAFALTTSLFMLQEPPLLVLGDVLADFLRRPDRNTSNLSFIRGKKWASHTTGPVKAHYDTRYHGCAPRFKAFFQVEDEAEPCWYLLLFATMISLTQIGNKVTSKSALGILITPDSPR